MAFGSNLEDKHLGSKKLIQTSYVALMDSILTHTTFSPFFQTPAFPAGSGPDYVNSVVRAETRLGPQDLLAALHGVEKELGRVRQVRWGARVIDIDILDYDGRILPSPEVYRKWRDMPLDLQKTTWPDDLILPHPRLQDRGFVLVPLKTVAPTWVHPVTHTPIDTLLGRIDSRELREIVQI
ncbi:MAG: 2-amino-4-hydroxy-6-hydroxymethyldihydropteridine diphosphokinase [Rhodobacterales bacterium]